MADSLYWADQVADSVIKERGSKKKYTCAAGITPSGTIHIGNFREVITVDLVARALKSKGKNVRFIYSWDNYDRFRKVPANMPNPNLLKKYLFQPVVDVPDTTGKYKNYAEHLEKEFEKYLPKVGIKPHFIYQSKMYRAKKYAEQIKEALLDRRKIAVILNKYRKEPLLEHWYPVGVFCETCNTDETKVIDYDNNYTLTYVCRCEDKTKTTNFKKQGNVKLIWRADWPMRWAYEHVDFEPGGKDHSTPGGSRTTAVEIVKEVWKEEPPVYQMYDFVILKSGGKISSSAGNVVTLSECLDIYLPEIIRFLFTGKPVTEFTIPFDEEVIKVYEDFYETERIYYNVDKLTGQKKKHYDRVYEMSCVAKPSKKIPVQFSFRQAIELINIYKSVGEAQKQIGRDKRTKAILECAKNWLGKYAPEKYKFSVNDKTPKINLGKGEREAIKEMGELLLKKHYTAESLFVEFGNLADKHKIERKNFFAAAYRILVSKENGPRLAPFILAIGKYRVGKLFTKV